MGVYDLGDEVQYLGTFRDAAGVLVTPGTVRFRLTPPGMPGTYYATAGGTVGTPAAGSVTYTHRYDRPGYWGWGWEGTGTINATAYGRDFVRYLEGGTP